MQIFGAEIPFATHCGIEPVETGDGRTVLRLTVTAEVQNNLGIVHFDKLDFEKAAETYRKAIEISEEYPVGKGGFYIRYRVAIQQPAEDQQNDGPAV